MTKTITLELDAYKKLKAAKRWRDFFSSEARRCMLRDGANAGAALLDYLQARTTLMTGEELAPFESIDRNRNHALPAIGWVDGRKIGGWVRYS